MLKPFIWICFFVHVFEFLNLNAHAKLQKNTGFENGFSPDGNGNPFEVKFQFFLQLQNDSRRFGRSSCNCIRKMKFYEKGWNV